MKRAIYAPQAEADILAAATHIAEDTGSIEAAHRFIDSIDHAAQLLATHPGLGRLRSELAPGLRSFPAGPFAIFYRARRGGVEIARVLHGSRDAASLF